MKTSPLMLSTLILLALFGVYCAYTIAHDQEPAAAAFKPISPTDYAGLIAWVFAVALFVERAIEVVVMVVRDQQADLLEDEADRAAQALATATLQAGALPAGDPGKAAALEGVARAGAVVAQVQSKQVLYRAETKEFALLVGFFFGILASIAGVRALSGLLDPAHAPSTLFTVADILITGALLAGGSEGIHRMANAFTGFMDSLSARTDQIQRNANNN